MKNIKGKNWLHCSIYLGLSTSYTDFTRSKNRILSYAIKICEKKHSNSQSLLQQWHLQHSFRKARCFRCRLEKIGLQIEKKKKSYHVKNLSFPRNQGLNLFYPMTWKQLNMTDCLIHIALQHAKSRDFYISTQSKSPAMLGSFSCSDISE